MLSSKAQVDLLSFIVTRCQFIYIKQIMHMPNREELNCKYSITKLGKETNYCSSSLSHNHTIKDEKGNQC